MVSGCLGLAWLSTQIAGKGTAATDSAPAGRPPAVVWSCGPSSVADGLQLLRNSATSPVVWCVVTSDSTVAEAKEPSEPLANWLPSLSGTPPYGRAWTA